MNLFHRNKTFPNNNMLKRNELTLNDEKINIMGLCLGWQATLLWYDRKDSSGPASTHTHTHTHTHCLALCLSWQHTFTNQTPEQLHPSILRDTHWGLRRVPSSILPTPATTQHKSPLNLVSAPCPPPLQVIPFRDNPTSRITFWVTCHSATYSRSWRWCAIHPPPVTLWSAWRVDLEQLLKVLLNDCCPLFYIQVPNPCCSLFYIQVPNPNVYVGRLLILEPLSLATFPLIILASDPMTSSSNSYCCC